jgi:hypothetical protein
MYKLYIVDAEKGDASFGLAFKTSMEDSGKY